jgi:hypothetical protein
MEGGRIEADGDSEMATIAHDQLERGVGPGGGLIGTSLRRCGRDMNRKERGGVGPAGNGRRGLSATSSALRWKSGAEAVEPATEGMEGDVAAIAELNVGQAGPTKVGQDG